MCSVLAQHWLRAAEELDLSIELDRTVSLSSGDVLRPTVLVSSFGAANGMLVFENYSDVASCADQLLADGFGYSVQSEPSLNENFNAKDYEKILIDWGWTGDTKERPDWF